MNRPPEISDDLKKVITRNRRRYIAGLRDWFFASAAIIKPSQWCGNEVVLNTPFARKQNVDFTGREYWRDMIDDIDDPEVLYQTKCCGTGAGKTTVDMLQLLWAFRHEPFSGIGVFPAKDGPGGATAFNNSCMIPTIEATPCFKKDIPTGARRHDFTGQKLVFAGNNFDWAGGQSAAQLGNKRCRIVNLQEQDKYKENLGREAGADYLAGERTKGMSGIKIIRGSTPSLEEFGIWPHLMKSDLRRRFLNCPICNSDLMSPSRRFVLVKDRQYTVLPTKLADGTEIPLAEFRWDKEAKRKDGSWDMDRVIASARFECPHCGGHIKDEHRVWMDKNGLWIPTRQGDRYHRGYHLPSFYAPMVKDKYGKLEFASAFGGMAQKFLKAKDSTQGMSGYINSDLAEVNMSQENASITISTTNFAEPEWTPLMSVDFQKLHPYLWFIIQKFCTFQIQPSLAWKDGKPDFVRFLDQSPPLKKQVEKIINGVETAWPALCEILRFDPRTGNFPPLDWLISNGVTGENLVKMFKETCGGKTMDFGNYIFHQMGKRVPKGGDSEIVAAGYCELSGDDAWAELKERQLEFKVGAQFEKSGTHPNRAVMIDSGYMESHNPEVLRKCYESNEQGRWWWYRKATKDFSIYRKDISDLPAPMDCWIPYKGYPIARRRWQSASGKDSAVHWGSDDPFKGLGNANTAAIQLLEGASEWYFHLWMDDRERQKEVLAAIAAHKSYRGNLWSVSSDLKLFPEHRFTREDFERQMNARGRNSDGEIWDRGTGGAGKRRHPDHLNDCARNMYALAEVHGFFNIEPTTKTQDTK